MNIRKNLVKVHYLNKIVQLYRYKAIEKVVRYCKNNALNVTVKRGDKLLFCGFINHKNDCYVLVDYIGHRYLKYPLRRVA